MKQFDFSFEVNTQDEARVAVQEARHANMDTLQQPLADAIKAVIAATPGSRFRVRCTATLEEDGGAGVITLSVVGSNGASQQRPEAFASTAPAATTAPAAAAGGTN